MQHHPPIRFKGDALMKNYIKIARPDHWVKNFFIYPGSLFALLLVGNQNSIPMLTWQLILGFFATCLIASANYVINEWLDAKFDQYHPTKKNRPVVQNTMSFRLVMIEYALLSVIGLGSSLLISLPFFYCELWLLVMGVLYNVKPLRTKDLVYLDVLSESINNAIRLLLGWFIVTSQYLPPITIVIGYWFGGAFLMAIKRYAEYRMIDDKATASLYRKSFGKYTEQSLLISAFFYAMCSLFLCGIFIIKYKIELLLLVPLLCGLFCLYFHLAFKKDSAVQKPEKLYKEKGLILYVFLVGVAFLVLIWVRIPALQVFLDSEIIRL